MRAVFADTFYWIAFTNPQDIAHESAKAYTLTTKPKWIVTTEEVLTEYLNYFAGWGANFRRKASLNVHDILRSPTVSTRPQSSKTFLSGLELYYARLDKGYSLTDCISMHTMRNEGITDILTNDVHFDQEGFRALLRSVKTEGRK